MSPLKPNSLSEKELILSCINGCRKSQKQLFEMFAPKMLTICMRYARHNSEAQDLLQEGFIKMFKNLSAFHFSGSFEGWVRRIMINNAIKNYNKKSFKNEQIGLPDHYDTAVAPLAISKLSEEELILMIQKLPEGYRKVFNLYVIEGFSHKEISQKLEIGESTSRSQLLKARKVLQEQINNKHKIAV